MRRDERKKKRNTSSFWLFVVARKSLSAKSHVEIERWKQQLQYWLKRRELQCR